MTSYAPLIVEGIATGSIYSVAAMGLTITYKTSGIFNFAQGAIAAAAAYVFYVLDVEESVAWPLAFAITLVLFGFVGGWFFERIARGLANVPVSQRIVATVGVLVAVQSLLSVVFGTKIRMVPEFLGRHVHNVGGAYFSTSDLVKALIALAAALGLGAFFKTTRTGKAMRAVVDDAPLVDMVGVNPASVRRTAWVIGTSFAAISGILIAPLLNVDVDLLTLLIVRAFGACAIGRFTSIPMTYAGGLIVGVGEQLVQNFTTSRPSLVNLYPATSFLILLGVMIFLPKGKLVEVGRLIRRQASRPPVLSPSARRVAATAGVAVLAFGPFYIDPVRLSTATSALAQVILYLSLTLLIRVSGQVSLCQVALQGAGAALFGHAVSHGGLGIFNLHLPWGFAVIAAGLLTVPLGLVIALPAVRLSGTFLALATLGFGLLLQQTGFNYKVLFGPTGSMPTPRPTGAHGDWAFYYVTLAAVLLCAALVKLVEVTRLGRLLRALADSPLALSTQGANATVSRNLAFALSAFLAGVSGAIASGVPQQSNSTSYQALASLGLLAILAISSAVGGGGTILPAFLAAVVFTFLPSYATSSDRGQFAFQLVFGVAAVAAALFSNGNGSQVFRRFSGRSDERLAASPVRDRLTEAAAPA